MWNVRTEHVDTCSTLWMSNSVSAVPLPTRIFRVHHFKKLLLALCLHTCLVFLALLHIKVFSHIHANATSALLVSAGNSLVTQRRLRPILSDTAPIGYCDASVLGYNLHSTQGCISTALFCAARYTKVWTGLYCDVSTGLSFHSTEERERILNLKCWGSISSETWFINGHYRAFNESTRVRIDL